MSADDSTGMSLKKVSVLTIGLVCYLLWGGAAAIYKAHTTHEATALDVGQEATPEGEAESEEQFRLRFGRGRGRGIRGGGLAAAVVVIVAGVWTFISNSITQLGSLPSLIPYMFTERMGYLVFCVSVLAVTGLGLFGMSRMQKSLESGNPFSQGRPRKKLPKIRTPKPLDDD